MSLFPRGGAFRAESENSGGLKRQTISRDRGRRGEEGGGLRPGERSFRKSDPYELIVRAASFRHVDSQREGETRIDQEPMETSLVIVTTKVKVQLARNPRLDAVDDDRRAADHAGKQEKLMIPDTDV